MKFCCALFAGLVFGQVAFASYSPGFTWNRQADWYGGTGDGTTTGNPNNDSLGNPAWRYAAVGGGGLGSANPWWSQGPGVTLGSFSGGPTGTRWYGGTAICEPPVLILEFGNPHSCPLVEWLNPTGGEASVHLSGRFDFAWSLGASSPVEYAIALRNRTTNASSLLFSGGANPSGPLFTTFNFQTTLQSDESLLFTFRATASSLGFYSMADSFSIQYIPAPSAVALLGLSSVVAVRRRRGK
jgi:hypothetical protein